MNNGGKIFKKYFKKKEILEKLEKNQGKDGTLNGKILKK